MDVGKEFKRFRLYFFAMVLDLFLRAAEGGDQGEPICRCRNPEARRWLEQISRDGVRCGTAQRQGRQRPQDYAYAAFSPGHDQAHLCSIGRCSGGRTGSNPGLRR
jgi:hypothetical protein